MTELNHYILSPAKGEVATATAAKLLQSCPTLCDPIDSSPLGSPVPGILQAKTMEWVAISFSRGSSKPKDRTQVSYVSCIGRQVLTTSATWEANEDPAQLKMNK